MLPFPICYISVQATDEPIRVPSKEEENEDLKNKAEIFISAVNSRDESTLQEIFAQGLTWESGYIKGDKDQLINGYKYQWTARKDWHLVLRTVNNAYIVDGQFKDRIPEYNTKAIVKLVKLDVTTEYDYTFTDGDIAKIVNHSTIYLRFENGKVVLVRFSSPAVAP
jgi:hypothetical protein